MLQQHRQITFRKLSKDLNISKKACHKIMREDLGKIKLNTRLAQRDLTQEQKDHRSTICADLLEGKEKSVMNDKLHRVGRRRN
jgi:hypothetical protein